MRRQDSLNPLNEESGWGRSCFLYMFHKKWHPNPNIYSTMAILVFLSAMFLVLAGLMLGAHKNVVEIKLTEYEQLQQCKAALQKSGKYCQAVVNIAQPMKSPIYVLYQLDNFYQNHRRYIQSKSLDQLQGKVISQAQATSSCYPIVLNKDTHREYAWDGKTPLNPNAVANPCGLIANSFFNDTYQFFNLNGSQIRINSTGISELNDRPGKYKRVPKSSSIQWIDPTNEHFIVWMRTAGLPSSRKLYGKIEEDLQPGKYIVRIRNNFNARAIKTDKSFVLTTANVFGGTNIFMTIAFSIAGIFCAVAALVFLGKLYMSEWTFGVK